MTPILQTESAVIGFLPDTLSCVVTEEHNGVYELTLTYPVSASMFSSLAAKRQTSLYNRKLICYYEAIKRSDFGLNCFSEPDLRINKTVARQSDIMPIYPQNLIWQDYL